jgi:peptidoglycan/LPS O-acetylase OafA/YrhL
MGALSTLVIGAWYLVQNTVRYGDPLARRATAHYLSKIGGLGTPAGQPYTVNDPLRFLFIQVPQRIVDTFWYLSGWNQFHWSWQVDVMFTLVFLAASAGLFHRRVNRRVLLILSVISIAAFLSVWGVALQSYYQARYAFVGLPAMAGLMALGVERWKLPVRFLLPVMGLIGILVAIQSDVLAIHWN